MSDVSDVSGDVSGVSDVNDVFQFQFKFQKSFKKNEQAMWTIFSKKTHQNILSVRVGTYQNITPNAVAMERFFSSSLF
jgi:hypothetical protein